MITRGYAHGVQVLYVIAYVDKSGAISSSQVVQHGSFVEVRQVCHVFDLLKLRRIHLLDLILLHHFLLHSVSNPCSISIYGHPA